MDCCCVTVHGIARLLYSRVANSWRQPCWPRDIYKFPLSVMIHATWPLILNEWVKRKTEGYGDTGINDLVPFSVKEKRIMKFGKHSML